MKTGKTAVYTPPRWDQATHDVTPPAPLQQARLKTEKPINRYIPQGETNGDTNGTQEKQRQTQTVEHTLTKSNLRCLNSYLTMSKPSAADC